MGEGKQICRGSLKLTLGGARIMLAASEQKAVEIGVPMDIAIVDDGGNLLLFERMDGAKITGIDIAINKAFTAACSRRGTHEYAEVASPGKPAFGIHVSNQGRFMIFGGGLPIVVDGEVVGGIGCSSGTAEQDRQVAQAGIDALQSR
ncbi:heme-binding protein [Candidatus Bathyarchaeota archaeon]|nr:heme-binding protein [Candidatus Bathyarchaeota archaeon]